MSKDEALRLALDALENLGNHDHVCPQWPTYAEPENYPKCKCGYDQAITAIKAALEAKDEFVACKECHLKDTVYDLLGDLKVANLKLSAQSQRTWVGLTNEERKDLCRSWSSPMDAIYATEAKLKEKNCANY